MGQPVVHFEVVGKDGEKLRSYYSDLFGWEFSDVMGQLFAGRLKPIVDRTFPLAETAAALSVLQRGEQFGKLVITIP